MKELNVGIAECEQEIEVLELSITRDQQRLKQARENHAALVKAREILCNSNGAQSEATTSITEVSLTPVLPSVGDAVEQVLATVAELHVTKILARLHALGYQIKLGTLTSLMSKEIKKENPRFWRPKPNVYALDRNKEVKNLEGAP